MASPKTSTPNIGFTLIEVLVVLGILVVLFGFGAALGLDAFRRYAFHNERDLLVAVMQKARSQSVSNLCLGAGCTGGRPHGVNFTSGGYTLFQGPSYAARDAGVDENYQTSYSINFSPSSFSEVVFHQLAGSASTTPVNVWNLDLSDTAGETSTITVNSEGRIFWTN